MQTGIPISIGFDPGSQIHLDSRYDNNGIPYTSIQQVLDLLPFYKRKKHLPVDINGIEHWFDTDDLNHLSPKNITEITSTGGTVEVTKTTNGYDLEVIKAELELYASNEDELIVAWQTAINSGKVTKIWITGNILFTANRQFIQGYSLPGIKFEATQQRTFDAQAFTIDFNNITFTNITFRTSGSFYFRLVGGIGNFYNCGYIDDVNDTSIYKKHIIVVGPITMNTAKIVIKQLTHFTQTASDNINNLIQPFVIENQATFTSGGNLYVEILEMAAVADFNRFSRVLLTSTIDNCPYNVTGDESWFYAPQQSLPSTIDIQTNIASYSNILKYASIDNLKALRLKTDNTGNSILGLDINGNVIKLDKSEIIATPTTIISSDDSIDVTKIETGYDLQTSNTRTIDVGAGLQEGVGLIYNELVHLDDRNIANEGWHIATNTNWGNLLVTVGGSHVNNEYLGAAIPLKESGNYTWPFVDGITALDTYGFRVLPAGSRSDLGIYLGSHQDIFYWSGDTTDRFAFYSSSNDVIRVVEGYDAHQGHYIRAVKDNTNLTIQGQQGEYIGNDSKKYITALIGNYEWTLSDLAETQWRDNTLVPIVADPTIWKDLTGPAVCAWNNDWSYIKSGGSTQTIDNNNVLSFKCYF